MKKLVCTIRFCRQYLQIDNGKYIYIYILYYIVFILFKCSMCNQLVTMITQSLINIFQVH